MRMKISDLFISLHGQMKYLYACLQVLWSCIIYLTVGRRSWILDDSPSVQDVLVKFPPLKKTRYV